MMKKKNILLSMVLAAFATGAARPVHAQEAEAITTHPTATQNVAVPRLVQFSGALKDSAARTVSGVSSVTFSIYAEQDGGTSLWSETQNVTADASGHYSVVLGSASAAGMPQELFGTGQTRWLGVQIARQAELPRVMLVSVPYALKAADAETLGGLPASQYITRGTAAVAGSSTIITDSAALPGAAQSGAMPFATPSGSGTTNFIPIWTSSSNLGNSLMFQTGGNVGINTTTPAETLDVNGNSIFRGSFQLPPGHPATSASGFESHSFQFQASSFNSSTAKSTTQSFGFRAEPLNNNTSNPSAVLDLFYIPDGGTDFKNTGVSFSTVGLVTAPSLNLTTATASTTHDPSVLLALNNTDNNPGNTQSVAMDFSPVKLPGNNDPAARIEFEDDGGNSAFINIDLKAPGNVTNTLVNAVTIFSDGSTAFAGSVSKASGTFKIDDPIDPANKYLSHSFVESPDMMNIYNGTVVLDAKGEATVTMPDWFDALNRSFQYQLTAVGAPGPGIYVAEKVHENRFKIAGGAPGLEISWQVTGVRHDAWAVAHPTPVEEAKPPREQGYYLHPELFGASQDKNVAVLHHQKSAGAPADPSASSNAGSTVQPASADQSRSKPSAGSTD
jgi:hypothetical protein